MKLQELFKETQEMCSDECCGVPANECHCSPDCPHCSCNAPGGPGPKAESKESINELDLLAPKQVYIKMPTGEFILATYRNTGASATGSGDLSAFTKFKKVSSQEAQQLGLEQYLDKRSPGVQKPFASPQEIQGGTMFDKPEVNVIEFNPKDKNLNAIIPDSVMSKLVKWVQNGMKEGIDEGVNDPNIFKAVFMAGGPGAGKSYVAQKLIGGTGLKTVNSDIALTWLMNKANLRLDMPDDEKEERDQVRNRAKEITKSQEDLYMQGRLGLLIDGTGKDIQKISAINKKLKTFGYETKMVFVNTDLETSLMRNQERAKQGDRTVDPAIAKDAWSKVQNNMMAYQQEFGKRNFYVVDNSDGPETDERNKNFEAVWKDLHAFLNSAPENPRAKAWMKQQKLSYTRPTKPDQDWETASRGTFDASKIADKFRKATLGNVGQ